MKKLETKWEDKKLGTSPLCPHNEQIAKQSEKATTLLRSLREGKSQGRQLHPKLERLKGSYREAQLHGTSPGAESSAGTTGRGRRVWAIMDELQGAQGAQPFFIAEKYFTVWMCHSLFIHSDLKIYIFSSFVNCQCKAMVSIYLQVFIWM